MSSSSPTTTTPPKRQDDADGASHTPARNVAADGSVAAHIYKLRGRRRARAHPAADAFPLLNEADLDVLAKDIKSNGLQLAVIVQKTKAGEVLVLDGRNRLRACEQAGVEPLVRHVNPSLDAVKVIVSANLQRRHQNPSQRAIAGARLANIGSRGRPGKNASLEAISQSAAAELVGVSRASLQRAATIIADPILAPAVDGGQVSVNDAYAIRGETDGAKRRAANAVSSGEAPTLQAALKREAAVDPAESTESGAPVASGSRTGDGSEPSMATERSGQRPGVPKRHPGSLEGEAGGATVPNDDSSDADDETDMEPDLEGTANGITDGLDRLLLIAEERRTRGVESPRVVTTLLLVRGLLEAMVRYLGQHADEDLPARLQAGLEPLLAFDVVDRKHVETPRKATVGSSTQSSPA